MEVIFCLVSRGTTVLAEFTRHRGNFETVSRLILRKIEDNKDGIAQIRYDDYVFHYKVMDGIIYLCMTDEAARTRLPMCFLDEVAATFRERYGVDEPLEAIAFSYDEQFSPVLRQKVEFFANNDEADIFGQVKAKIDNTKDELVVAIENILERGEKIELLVDKTDQLTESAIRFQRTATNLKVNFYWKRLKVYLFVFFILALVAFFISVMACGITFSNCA
ncbi:hypothetical protein CTAYLR_009278 [Chrysophaeum taylorii]|uniref:Vesicle-associated membrane protein n=1 Tax=Chrysophaeum taylorii TaxID=2483200 RepID=A0AAD7XNT7_9STRA|nr:hypothetical protein CTAYLR_009278 [Chrysophaeum taylorii]